MLPYNICQRSLLYGPLLQIVLDNHTLHVAVGLVIFYL